MLPVSNDYVGEITRAELSESEDGSIAAHIWCRPEGSAVSARWRGTFDETRITRGSNEGRQWGEITAETLGEFGVTDFTKIGDIKGVKCSFGVKHSPPDKNGKIWVEVNFIHPIRVAKPVSARGIAGLNRFKGAAIKAAQATGATAPRAQTQHRTVSASENRGDAYEDLDDYHDPLA